MKKPTVLKMNGKSLDLNPPRPIMARITAFLDKLPDDELLGKAEVATRSQIGDASVWDFSVAERYQAYIHRHGRTVYFGNPRAIVALKQFLAEQGK